jgi:hypothetical protein
MALGEEQTITARVTRVDGSPLTGSPVVIQWTAGGMEREKLLPSTDEGGWTSSSWRDDGAAPGEIINLIVSSREGEAYGVALLQYAYGFPPGP